jgi:hypothetical protein
VLAAPLLRADHVVVEPLSQVLGAGATFPFTALLVREALAEAKGDSKGETKEERKEVPLAWRWRVLGQDKGTIDPHTGLYTAPEVKGLSVRKAFIEATAPSAPKASPPC